MKFCKHCGNEIKPFHSCTCEEAQKETEQKESKLAIIIGASVVGIIAVVLLLVFGVFGGKINALDYVKVEFDGSNGYGTAEVSLDDRALISKIIGEEPSELNFEDYIKWEVKYEEYSDVISYECDKTEELSNGDTVVVTITVEGAAASKIKGGSKKFKVENLPEAESVDVFKDVEFEITGISGDGTLKIRNNSQNEFAKNCTFFTDKEYNLTNGDVITVTLEFTEYYSVNLNSVPKETTKKITVSGLPEFMEPKDITKDLINKIKTNFETKELSLLEEEKEARFKKLSYVGTYFYTPTHDPDMIPSKLIVIYSADRYDEAGTFDEKVYLSLEYRGDEKYKEKNYKTLVTFPDGTNNIIHEDLDIDVDSDSLDEVLANHRLRYFSEPYTYEKID